MSDEIEYDARGLSRQYVAAALKRLAEIADDPEPMRKQGMMLTAN
jgi:hypothetical protein